MRAIAYSSKQTECEGFIWRFFARTLVRILPMPYYGVMNQPIHLTLFISSEGSAAEQQVLEALDEVADLFVMSVINISENPEVANLEKVTMTPALVVETHLGRKLFYGIEDLEPATKMIFEVLAPLKLNEIASRLNENGHHSLGE